jgi:hypothetical protein
VGVFQRSSEAGIDAFVAKISIDLPPIANAGSSQTVACSSSTGAMITLNGVGSNDPDGQPITYLWSGPFGSASGPTPAVLLPLGSSTLTLVVNDGTFNSQPATVTDTVIIGVNGLGPPLATLVRSGNAPTLPGNSFHDGRTLPLKLQLLCGTTIIRSGVNPPQIISIIRNGGALDMAALDLDAGLSNDNSLLFRPDGSGNWVYNLSTADLPVGTYTITVRMPDGLSYDAAFVLR